MYRRLHGPYGLIAQQARWVAAAVALAEGTPSRHRDRMDLPLFDPRAITNLDAWLAADSLITDDGVAIATWPDLSGRGHDATQGTAANRPAYKAGILNAKPVVRFDGTNDQMSLTVTAGAAKTLLIVMVKRSAPASLVNLILFATTSCLRVNSATDATRIFYSQNQAGSPVVLTGATAVNWNLITLLWADASHLTPYTNGVAQATFDPNDSFSTATTLYLGSTGAGTDIDIAELLIYSKALSAAELEYVHAYLNAKYALY